MSLPVGGARSQGKSLQSLRAVRRQGRRNKGGFECSFECGQMLVGNLVNQVLLCLDSGVILMHRCVAAPLA